LALSYRRLQKATEKSTGDRFSSWLVCIKST
jgi:hypothetical protein